MKLLCAKTIKGVIKRMLFFTSAVVVLPLFNILTAVISACNEGESGCTKPVWMIVGISAGGSLFLYIAFKLIRRRLVGRFRMYWIFLCLKQLKCDFRTRKDRSGVLKRNVTLHFPDDQIMWIDHRKEIRTSLQWSIHIINPVDKTKWLWQVTASSSSSSMLISIA